jgi:anti-sigma regulatory factor (Ser/Thr protein kinase)
MTRDREVGAVSGIVLVQDRGARAARLHAALAEQPELAVLADVATTHEAVASAREHQPGVVVMDVGMDAVAGQTVLKSIREVAPATRIVLHAWDGTGSDTPGEGRWISRLTSVVLDPDQMAFEARVVLPDGPRGVALARSFTSELLAQWGLDTYLDSARLLVSELVANAVLHARGPTALELTHHGDVLRVAVADAGEGMPDLQVMDFGSEGGRGLHIVSALSSAWGVDSLDDGGKLIWAELDPVAVEVS